MDDDIQESDTPDEKVKVEDEELALLKEEQILEVDIDKETKEFKLGSLRALCDAKERDGLAALALSKHGLVNDEIRKRAWPLLLGYDPSNIWTELEDAKVKLEDGKVVLPDYLGLTPYTDLPPHRDEYQVELDVNRSFVYYPTGKTPKHQQLVHEAVSSCDTDDNHFYIPLGFPLISITG
ncbi:hypothetical protein ABW20_dc0101446 [Dactylellina cionopaga]|nr:hypothetical protein ABW20_dc0101446 [Dactylellina cionopaga]